MKIKKLTNQNSKGIVDMEDVINKINEIIDAVNSLDSGISYSTDKPSAYDLNAVAKHLKRR